MALHLYYAPMSCALATHIVLEYLQADYTAEKLNLRENDQQSPHYLAINPKGRVPALVTEEGILTETPALLFYLAQRFPKAMLAPLNDPFALATLQSINSWFCSTVHVHHAHGARARRWSDDSNAQQSMQKKVTENMTDCAALIEREILNGPWVMGTSFTVADPYLFTMTTWMKGDGVALHHFPKLTAHYQRMLEEPAVKTVALLHGIQTD